MHHLKSAAVAGALAIAAMGACASSASAATLLTFCNKNGAKLDIAVSYQDATTNRWIMSAWHGVPPAQCKPFGMIKTGLFYYYAEKEGTKSFYPAPAQVEKTWCLPRTGLKRDMTVSHTCGSNERNYGFRGRVPTTDRYTFTFE